MPHNTKIATCCYCGTRAVLAFAAAPAHPSVGEPSGRGGPTHHELVCSACGAPLRDLKPIKRAPEAAVKARARPDAARKGPDRPKREKKRKLSQRRRSVWRAIEEFVDELEDLFD